MVFLVSYWNADWVEFEDKIYHAALEAMTRSDALTFCREKRDDRTDVHTFKDSDLFIYFCRDASPHRGHLSIVDHPIVNAFLTCYMRHKSDLGQVYIGEAI